MDELDLGVRNATYRLFAEHGRAPSAVDVATDVRLDVPTVIEAWRRLHDAHALVLQPDRAELRMANPFSAVPTAFRVEAGGRWWDANCAWDAFGVCAALHTDGRIETTCADCGQPLQIEVRGEAPDRDDLLFHCLVPAAGWWDDIGFT